MDFGNMRIRDIYCVVRYVPQITRWKAQGRTDHIVGIQLRGDCFHDFGYQQFSLTEGCVFFFNQKDDYSVEVLEPGESFSVHFTTYEPIETDSFCKKIGNAGEVVRMIEQVERARNTNRQSDILAVSQLYRFCDYLERLRLMPYQPADNRIAQAQKYLDLHFKDVDCLDAAAVLCGVTRRRFNDLFKLHLHITPNRYVTQCKITLAKDLLRLKNLSIAEVSELSGFNDLYYFSKCFKKETGFTPSGYQRLVD